jgi:phage terminase small subunit
MPPQKKLSLKHLAFCSAYLSNGENGTQAAITAQYSAKTAGQIAHKLLKRADIQAHLSLQAGKIQKKADLSLARIEQELSDLLDFDPALMFDADGKLLKLKDMPANIRKSIQHFEQDKQVQKVKTISKLSVIELVMKLQAYGRHDQVAVAITTVLLQDKPVSELPVIDQALLKPEW